MGSADGRGVVEGDWVERVGGLKGGGVMADGGD